MVKKILTEFKEYPINLKSSKIVIAMVQLEGPYQDGKHKIVVGNRETFEWKSINSVNIRIKKACDILDSLNKNKPKPDIVVFPEYSIPLEQGISELQKRADKFDQIIIGGADNIIRQGFSEIYNECPIILPNNKEPIWILKRQLSPAESSFMDVPSKATIPIFTWECGQNKHWLLVYTCLDFTLVFSDSYDFNNKTGIFIVPMCSQELALFHTYSDVLLREGAGTATILCNCVGDPIPGSSCVFAVTPDGERLKPAFQLPKNKESVGVFSINCRHLNPPKKKKCNTESCLSMRKIYGLKFNNNFELANMQIKEKESITRGVINPKIFDLCGKKMRICFLKISKYPDEINLYQDLHHETLAILGNHDLMITNINTSNYDFIYDIKRGLSINKANFIQYDYLDNVKINVSKDNFPYFEVEEYYKVMGICLDKTDRSIYEIIDESIPTSEEIEQIIALGKNWNDKNIKKGIRKKFKERRWILGETTKQPGVIDAIITLHLDYSEFADVHKIFKKDVLPKLMNHTDITSIYGGSGRRVPIHYVLRITSDVKSLFELIEKIYKIASLARIMITSMTYVVIKRISYLHLDRKIPLPVIPSEKEYYRNTHFLPLLSNDEGVEMISTPRDEQLKILNHFNMIETELMGLNKKIFELKNIAKIKKNIAKGLLKTNYDILYKPHYLLQGKVEETISKSLDDDKLTENNFKKFKRELNILSQKSKKQLSYNDKIKLFKHCINHGIYNFDIKSEVNNLLLTISIRNALTHKNYDKLTPDLYSQTIKYYCDFLSKWMEIHEDIPE
jgi:hypothetical protein